MKFKRLFAFVLSSIITLGVFCVPVFATSNSNITVYSAVNDFKVPNEYLYGRQQLASMQNSTYLLNLYDALYNGIENMSEKISISVPVPSNIMQDNNALNSYLNNFFNSVWYPAWEAYTNDHPEQFWWAYVQKDNNQVSPFISANFSIDTEEGNELVIKPNYDAELYSKKANFENEVKKLLYGLTSKMDEYTREKIIHDRLLAKTTYLQAEHSSCAYGAIIDGKAVCEGYARAFQYLLMRAGIFSHTVTGYTYETETSYIVNHAWNIVKLGNDYCYTDCTWDDQNKSEYISYAYFNLGDDDFKNHWLEMYYEMPACSSVNAYFNKSGNAVKTHTFNVNQIAQLMKNGNGTARIYTDMDDDLYVVEGLDGYIYETNTTTVFWDYFDADMNTDDENHQKIVKQLGITGDYNYGIRKFFREIIAYVYGKGKMTLCGTVVGLDNSQNTVVQLIKGGVVKETFTGSGAVFDYSFNNIDIGNYTLKVIKDGHAVHTEQITCKQDMAQVKNITLYLYGDVNSDGAFNLSDLVRLKKCIANSAVINNEAFNITFSSEYSGKLVEMRKMLLSQ